MISAARLSERGTVKQPDRPFRRGSLSVVRKYFTTRAFPCQCIALPHKESTRKRFVASDKKVLEGRRTPSPACRRQGGRRRWPYRCERGKRSPRRWRGATSAPASGSAG